MLSWIQCARIFMVEPTVPLLIIQKISFNIGSCNRIRMTNAMQSYGIHRVSVRLSREVQSTHMLKGISVQFIASCWLFARFHVLTKNHVWNHTVFDIDSSVYTVMLYYLFVATMSIASSFFSVLFLLQWYYFISRILFCITMSSNIYLFFQNNFNEIQCD